MYAYDPYGKVIAFSGSNAPNPFQFTGQYTDVESGLQYLRARYYDPSTAQFISSDPLSLVTRHRYAYASGNPIDNVDPTGMFDLLNDIGPIAGLISTFLAGMALISIPDPVVSGVLDVASTAFGVLAAVYDCKANWFSWNCASSVAGAVIGGLSIVARVARLIWTLPVVFSHLNLQSVAYWIIDMWGGAEKLNAFAYQALRLQHMTESLGYYALSTAFAAADTVIHAVIDLAQPAAAAGSGSGMPSPVPAC